MAVLHFDDIGTFAGRERLDRHAGCLRAVEPAFAFVSAARALDEFGARLVFDRSRPGVRMHIDITIWP